MLTSSGKERAIKMVVKRPNNHYKDLVTLWSVYISGMVVITNLIFQLESGTKENQLFELLQRTTLT